MKVKMTLPKAQDYLAFLSGHNKRSGWAAVSAQCESTNSVRDALSVVGRVTGTVGDSLKEMHHPVAEPLGKYTAALGTANVILSAFKVGQRLGHGNALQSTTDGLYLTEAALSVAVRHPQLAGVNLPSHVGMPIDYTGRATGIVARLLEGFTEVKSIREANRKITESAAVLGEFEVSEAEIQQLEKELQVTSKGSVTLSEAASVTLARIHKNLGNSALLQASISNARDTVVELNEEHLPPQEADGSRLVAAIRQLDTSRAARRDKIMALTQKIGGIAAAVLGMACVAAMIPTGVLVPVVIVLGTAVAALGLYRAFAQKRREDLPVEDKIVSTIPVLPKEPPMGALPVIVEEAS